MYLPAKEAESVTTANPIPLILNDDQKRQIEADGLASYPNECCGIIYGREVAGRRIVEELETVANAFESGEQYHRFSISGEMLMKAEKKCTGGKMVLGFYHSHPDHPARPSEYDRVHAWPFYSYVIVAIHQKVPKDMTCWLLDESSEQFVSQAIGLD
jgi:proteasome lid subunit RPN8/RPN11